MKLNSYYNPTTRNVRVQLVANAAPAAPYVLLGALTHEEVLDNLSGAQKHSVSHAIYQHVQEQLYVKYGIQNMQNITITNSGTFKLVDRFWVSCDSPSVKPGETVTIKAQVEPADATVDGYYIAAANPNMIQVTQSTNTFTVTFLQEGETLVHVGLKNSPVHQILSLECYSNRRQPA